MGSIRFRRTKKIGPFRINLTKTGVGISAGVPGARASIHSSGRVTKTVGIPGSGLYYRDDSFLKPRNSQPAPVSMALAPEIANYRQALIVLGRELATVYTAGQNWERVLTANPDDTNHDEQMKAYTVALNDYNRDIAAYNQDVAAFEVKYGPLTGGPTPGQ